MEEVAQAAVEEKTAKKNTKVKKEVPATACVRGLVMYSDGGARPSNPGFSATGLHGYIFNTALPLKGVGLGSVVTTSRGYQPKAESEDPTGRDEEWILNKIKQGKFVLGMPEKYIETIAVAGISRTNQVAELLGVLHALKHFIEMTTTGDQGDSPLKFVQIMSDSEYACKGTNQHVHNWAANNWFKKDGTQPANLEIWKDIHTALTVIRDSGGIVKLDWVRGHNGEIGNERTDVLATMGIFHVMKNMDEGWRHDVSMPADGYWKVDNEHHPMLAHKCTYFNTLPGATTPGTYYLGNHGKDEELLGSRMSDGSFAVVRLEAPDTSIEMIRKVQADYSKGADSLFSANLTHLFDADFTYFTNTYGELGIRPINGYRLDLDFVGKKPLTREYKPARISMRAVDALELLDQHLSDFLEGKGNIRSTDITSLLFEKTSKTVKGVEESIFKLRPEIVVGLPALNADITNPVDPTGKPFKLTLTVGQDLLARNSLKRLEELKPEVYVVTWLEGEKAFRYATVIKAQGCVGIWAGYYSNLRLVA